MKRNLPKWFIPFVMSALAIFIVIVGGTYFIGSTEKDVEMQNRQYLREISRQNAYVVKNMAESELDKISAIANIIGIQEEFNLDYTIEVLAAESKRVSFKRLAYIPPDGNAVTTDGVSFNVLDRKYFQKALSGEACISDLMRDKIDGELIHVYAVPLYHNGTIQGVIIATNDTNLFADVLNADAFNGEGSAYVVDKDGSAVAFSKEDHMVWTYNLFDKMKGDSKKHQDIQEMQKRIEQGKEGIVEYTMNEMSLVGAYSKIGINDWYVLSVVPRDVIYRNTDRLLIRNIASVVMMGIVLGVFVSFFSIQNYRSNKKISRIAFTDPLTGGNNLNKFKILAAQVLDKERDELYMVRIDIDNFRLINDMYGYEEGDRILQDMAHLISVILTRDDIYGRSGSDNFLCLIRAKSDEKVIAMGGQFREAFKERLNERKKQYVVNFTTGVYKIAKSDERDMDKIIDRTTMAHRHAKTLPNERKFAFYSDNMRAEAVRVKNIEDIMHGALERREFVVYLQPKYDLGTGKMEGAEALIRWVRDGKVIAPSEFVPVFEKNGFIVNIDMFAMEEVCRMQRRWLDKGMNPLPISVNQSKSLVYGKDYIETCNHLVHKYRLPPYLIELELLESIIHDNVQKLKEITESLRADGFLICIDDFGSGYSSLNMLKDIYADVLKIDRGFLSSAQSSERAEMVLANVIRLARDLNMSVVTEGVETQQQAELLKNLGCHTVQGYWYAKPMTIAEYEERLQV